MKNQNGCIRRYPATQGAGPTGTNSPEDCLSARRRVFIGWEKGHRCVGESLQPYAMHRAILMTRKVELVQLKI